MADQRAIKQVLEQAGALALKHFRRVTPKWKAESHSYVTVADLEVQAYLVDWLRQNFPEDGIVAEEEDCRVAPHQSKRYWSIDPIDGTASFVAGLPFWGIGLGLMDAGQPVAGYFYVPTTGDYFCSSRAGDVLRNAQPAALIPPRPLQRESVLLSVSRLHRRVMLQGSYPGKVRSLGSTIGHICYVATGSADAALLGRVWLWDLLPGYALLKAAGGVLKYLHGTAVDLQDLVDGSKAPELMICGHAGTIARYEEVLARNVQGKMRHFLRSS